MSNMPMEGLQFGYGLFETMRKTEGQIQHVNRHYNRLVKSMAALDMPVMTFEDFESLLAGARNGVVRLTCLLDGQRVQTLVTERDLPYKTEDYKRGYSLGLSPIGRHSTNPIYQHKTTNGINNLMEKRNSNFDELLHLNETSKITEGIYANVFFVKSDCLFTPAVDTGLLPGVMRSVVLDTAKVLGIPMEIGYYSIEDILQADEVFLTNALMGIMPVRSVLDKTFDLKTNPITQQLMKEMES